MAKSFKAMAKSLDRYVTKDLKGAAVTAANRAAESTRTLATRLASDGTGIKQAELRKTNRVKAYKATVARPSAAMIVNAKPISLMSFTPKEKAVSTNRGKRTGVTVVSAAGRVLVPGGFIAAGNGGANSVFARVGTERSPIKRLTSDAVITFIEKPEVTKQLEDKMTEAFEKALQSQMSRLNLRDTD